MVLLRRKSSQGQHADAITSLAQPDREQTDAFKMRRSHGAKSRSCDKRDDMHPTPTNIQNASFRKHGLRSKKKVGILVRF